MWDIIRMGRAKVHAVAAYVVRGVVKTTFCSMGAGAATVAAVTIGGYMYLWIHTGIQPPTAVMLGLAALSEPFASSAMGIVALLGLVILIVGTFFRIIGDPKDPNDLLNQGMPLLAKPPSRRRPPIAWTEE